MKVTRKDLAALKYPFLVLALTLMASIALVKITSAMSRQAEQQNSTRMLALQDARSRYQRSGDERETILRFLPAYEQLQKQGFVGSEQRINWLEGLRTADGQAGLFGVTYRLEPQKSFALLSPDNPLAPYLRHSNMKITFGLVHEADLMHFLNALSAQQTGVFMLTDCALDPVGGEAPPAPRQANLTAKCELNWLTIEAEKRKS